MESGDSSKIKVVFYEIFVVRPIFEGEGGERGYKKLTGSRFFFIH